MLLGVFNNHRPPVFQETKYLEKLPLLVFYVYIQVWWLQPRKMRLPLPVRKTNSRGRRQDSEESLGTRKNIFL